MQRPGRVLRFWPIWPATLWTLVFFVLALGAMLALSFAERAGDRTVAWPSLANYQAFVSLGGGALVKALVNSIEVTLAVTAISVALAYPLAYILAYRVPARWQRLLLILIVLPFWTSYVVRSYSWLLVLSENGVISTLLLDLGVIDRPIGMGNTRGATILGFVHFFVMLLTLTIFSNLVQIKDSYRRAAADLGATAWQTFLHVTLPLSLPGVVTGAFLTFVLAIGDYITPQILGGSRELLLPQAIMLQVGRQANFPMASALSMILMLVVSAAFLLTAKRLRMERV
ncbi:MAG: spermidine/putrescine ABC transporter permease [Alphaproteobacteria bacterium]|nr:MAG: spermidine/putrescine ABC transporter permease [Alphaproteobacteria bacterium]